MEEQRLTKLEKIKKQGKNPYPNHFCPTHTTAQIQASYGTLEGEALEKKPSIRLAGRILALRSFGKAAFIHLQDRAGKLQAYVAKDVLGEERFNFFSELIDIGDIVGVEGTLFRTKTKELTLKVSTLELLSKSLYPLPEKWHGLTDVEVRYRQRYLDLIVNPKVREIFQKRSQVIQHIRQFFLDREYLEVETPMMHPIPGDR